MENCMLQKDKRNKLFSCKYELNIVATKFHNFQMIYLKVLGWQQSFSPALLNLKVSMLKIIYE